ncbi:hypothetical protein G7Y79_00006g018190 [Physcia stellaris]|nr:hypothetical protein G7Y79_00006g018190 [Physcia stellaris]
MNMVSQVTHSTPTHIVLDSYESQMAYKAFETPSNRGRLRIKRIVEGFLCLRPDDASSHLPASIRVTSPDKSEKGVCNNSANKCVKGDVASDDENKAESCKSSEENDTAPIEQSSSAGSSDHGGSDLSDASWKPRSDSTSSEVSFQQTVSLTNLSQRGPICEHTSEHAPHDHTTMIVQANGVSTEKASINEETGRNDEKSGRHILSLVANTPRRSRATLGQLGENNFKKKGPIGVSAEFEESARLESHPRCSSASLSSSDDLSSSQEQSSNTSSRTSDSPSHSNATRPMLMHGEYSPELKLPLGKNQEADETSDSQIGSFKPKQNQVMESKAVVVSEASLSLLTGCPEAIYSPAQAGEVQNDSNSPPCEISVIRGERKVGLRQRLKKLAIEKGKAINARSLVLRSLSASSKESENTPARGKSRRRRIIEWIKHTGHMSGNDTGSSHCAEEVILDLNLEKILPEVPQVSDFDLLNTDGPNVETNTDEAGVNGVVGVKSPLIPQCTPEGHLKMPCYDAGVPVDDDNLYDEGFTPAQICYALMDGTLDEARMQRLKQGFAALLDSL